MIIFLFGPTRSGKTAFSETIEMIMDHNGFESFEAYDNCSWQWVSDNRNKFITWPSRKILVVSMLPEYFHTSCFFPNATELPPGSGPIAERDKLNKFIDNLVAMGRRTFLLHTPLN